jgi:hypothetical protein
MKTKKPLQTVFAYAVLSFIYLLALELHCVVCKVLASNFFMRTPCEMPVLHTHSIAMLTH